jgi:hypothetical protein
LEHVTIALAGRGQRVPQAPQFCGSVIRFAHTVAHAVSGGVQEGTQPADEHH